jgi:1,2-diacylglycerol 3-alpha-glucosyltransferase
LENDLNLVDGPSLERPLKIFFACTGVGTANRGIESFFRECFNGLHGYPGLDITLLKVGESSAHGERRVWCLPRDGSAAARAGRLIHRDAYVVEQLTSVLPIVHQIRKHKPDVVFSSDCNMMIRLVRYRKLIGRSYRVIYSNGAPLGPPFSDWDHVHHVTPFEYEIALRAGEPSERNSMVPYGIQVPEGDPITDRGARAAIRQRLNLPLDRQIILSVGWISAFHKRMDYLIDEISQLAAPRPYLVMLGSMDEKSAAIIQRANEKLGPENFTARSVPYQQVADFYQSADLFTLCSLREGFGRVYMEAQLHGLPCIVHDHPVTRFVLGNDGKFVDMNRAGTLAEAIVSQLRQPLTADIVVQRRQSVRDRFNWPVLAPAYRKMFRAAVRTPVREKRKAVKG